MGYRCNGWPYFGTVIRGWLTEYYNWRRVFYINIPFGALAWFGIAAFVKETAIDTERKFDLFGFALLAVAIGSLQMFLDRGESQNWYASMEIIIETGLAVLAMYMFIVHMFTAKKPFLDPVMFSDRNFVVGITIGFMMGWSCLQLWRYYHHLCKTLWATLLLMLAFY